MLYVEPQSNTVTYFVSRAAGQPTFVRFNQVLPAHTLDEPVRIDDRWIDRVIDVQADADLGQVGDNAIRNFFQSSRLHAQRDEASLTWAQYDIFMPSAQRKPSHVLALTEDDQLFHVIGRTVIELRPFAEQMIYCGGVARSVTSITHSLYGHIEALQQEMKNLLDDPVTFLMQDGASLFAK